MYRDLELKQHQVAEHITHSSKDIRLSAWAQSQLQNGVWHIGRYILKAWFALDCEGTENIPQHGAYLIASNHSSHLDGPAIIAAHNKHLKNVYSLAASDYFFNHPLKERLFSDVLNMIPFSRKGISRDCIPLCKSLLANNKAILIFPEGTRSPTGNLQIFKSGLGLLALELGVPIVPAYICGSFEALPKGNLLPKKHPIRVIFGAPLEVKSYQIRKTKANSRQIYQELVNDVYYAIESLRDDL